MNQKQFEMLCSQIAEEKNRILEFRRSRQDPNELLTPITNLLQKLEKIEPALKDNQLIDVGARVGNYLKMVATSVDEDPHVRDSVHAQASRAAGMYAKRAFRHRQMRSSP